MNKLILTIAAALCVGVSAFAAATSELTTRDRKDAERCGIAAEQWKAMTKKARKAARDEAKAKALGMTVAEMKAERNRKDAEKVGCDPEVWAKMSVRERCAYRKQAKAKAQKPTPVPAE